MVLTVYIDLLSQPCRALYITLKLHNVTFKPQYISIEKGEHRTSEFTQNISRFNKLPVIDDDGFKLTESVGILRYLAKTKTIRDSYYPQDAKKQARVDEFLEWHHTNLRSLCSPYFIRKWILPKFFGKVTPADKLRPYFNQMVACLDNMERLWLNSDGLYIIGDQLTAADIWAACEIEQLTMTGYDPKIGRPKLAAFLERVRNETNPYFDEAHKEVYEYAELDKKNSKL
ncbi:glutathione s-transferase n-terminal domain [Holotrichia oblita]|uniref:Glutathione s-transferase n-terminal domain n=1 Tax=Holotrichia oblita TaxID=644536 RepID=A0ACB9T805_HOLOL|nr:glutathione s-transferase n-terminal domain [Holotrichia oblita]